MRKSNGLRRPLAAENLVAIAAGRPELICVALHSPADLASALERADLVAIGRELLNNPNWVLDAAEKLGEEAPFKTVPENYGYWLEKRAQAGFAGRASTWMPGIDK